jgi:hypothetical protein
MAGRIAAFENAPRAGACGGGEREGEPAKSEARVTMSGKVSADLAAQFRDAAFKIAAL